MAAGAPFNRQRVRLLVAISRQPAPSPFVSTPLEQLMTPVLPSVTVVNQTHYGPLPDETMNRRPPQEILPPVVPNLETYIRMQSEKALNASIIPSAESAPEPVSEDSKVSQNEPTLPRLLDQCTWRPEENDKSVKYQHLCNSRGSLGSMRIITESGIKTKLTTHRVPRSRWSHSNDTGRSFFNLKYPDRSTDYTSSTRNRSHWYPFASSTRAGRNERYQDHSSSWRPFVSSEVERNNKRYQDCSSYRHPFVSSGVERNKQWQSRPCQRTMDIGSRSTRGTSAGYTHSFIARPACRWS